MKFFTSLTSLAAVLLLIGWSNLLPSMDSVWRTSIPERPSPETKKTESASRATSGSRVLQQSSQNSEIAPVQVLRKAHEVLKRHRSFKAKIEQEFVIEGRMLNASGKYFHAPGFKLRMEMTVRIGTGKNAIEGSLLQVCDGQVLWTRHQVAGKPRITRRDVRQIASAAESAGLSKDNFLVMNLGLGGLPSYLAALEKCFDFNRATKEVIKGNEVYVIDGVWTDLYRKHFEAIDPRQKYLPAHIPDRVRLVFDKEFIPRRIIYAKLDSASDELKKMVTLRFNAIEINNPIDESTFRFVPTDGVYQDDITNAYVNQIKTIPNPKK